MSLRSIVRLLLILALVALLYVFVGCNVCQSALVVELNKAAIEETIPEDEIAVAKVRFCQIGEGIYYVDGEGLLSQYDVMQYIVDTNTDVTQIEHLFMGDGITAVGTNCFAKCINLKSIRLGDQVVEVMKYAFTGCPNLKAVYWPDHLTKVSEKAFYGCINLHYLCGKWSIRDKALELFPEGFLSYPLSESDHVVMSINMGKMMVYGDGYNDDGTIVLNSGGRMYGPYCYLPTGAYTVKIHGLGFLHNLVDRVWCNAGYGRIDVVSDVIISDTEITFTMVLPQAYSDLEICCENVTDHQFIINGVEFLCEPTQFGIPSNVWNHNSEECIHGMYCGTSDIK